MATAWPHTTVATVSNAENTSAYLGMTVLIMTAAVMELQTAIVASLTENNRLGYHIRSLYEFNGPGLAIGYGTV